MKKFIQTIRNIFKIEELRKRIVYTILLLLVYRLGSFIVGRSRRPAEHVLGRCFR